MKQWKERESSMIKPAMYEDWQHLEDALKQAYISTVFALLSGMTLNLMEFLSTHGFTLFAFYMPIQLIAFLAPLLIVTKLLLDDSVWAWNTPIILGVASLFRLQTLGLATGPPYILYSLNSLLFPTPFTLFLDAITIIMVYLNYRARKQWVAIKSNATYRKLQQKTTF